MFIYAKLVKILLKILGQSIGPHQRHESFVERIAIYLLNSLACQVEGWHKRLVGDLGAMKVSVLEFLGISEFINLISLTRFYSACSS